MHSISWVSGSKLQRIHKNPYYVSQHSTISRFAISISWYIHVKINFDSKLTVKLGIKCNSSFEACQLTQ